MSTFSLMVYINSMKQKGLPLVSNKAAPCTVLSHSLVDSAPHVHQNKRTDTYRQTEASHTTEPLPHMAQVTSCSCVTFPFLHPFSLIILINQNVNVFTLSKGLGPSAHS